MPVTTNHFSGWEISVIFDLTFLPGDREFDINFLENVKIPPYARFPPPPPPPAGLTLIVALLFIRFLRAVAYRWLVRWICGYMGWDNTRPLPACVYEDIRQKFNGFSTRALIGNTTEINSSQIKSDIGFCGEGKPEVSGEKLMRAEKRINKLNPHVMRSLGIEPGPYWWLASVFTAMQPLLF